MSENKMPTRPLPRTLKDIGRGYETSLFTLFNVFPAPENGWDMETPEGIERFYEDNFVVGVGKLNGKQLIAFEKEFRMSIDRAIMGFVVTSAHDMAMRMGGEAEFEAAYPNVIFDAENNVYYTPFGQFEGSANSLALRITAFLISQFGRVRNIDEDDNPVFEKLSMDDLLDYIDYDTLSVEVDGDESEASDSKPRSFLMEVLRITRAFDMDKVTQKPEEPKDDEVKNSPSPSESDNAPETSSPPKRNRKR